MCDYFKCEEEICEEDKELHPPTMRFCKKHRDELEGYFTATPFNPAKVIGFWVKSKGGAKRLADTF